MPWTTEWRVEVDGVDASNGMRSFLTDISVSDKDGTSSDSCSLKFDDTDGQIKLPKPRAAVDVYLQGVHVFGGFVDSTNWELSRGGGRILSVEAKGVDTRGKAKERQQWHLDDKTLKDALSKAGEKAGLSVTVDPELGAIQSEYWSPDGMSFTAWAQHLANRYGATFKIRGNKAVFAKRGTGTSATSGAMPTITASIPGNVISVRLSPDSGQRRYSKAKVRYFDRKSATFKCEEVDVDLDDVDVDNHSRELGDDSDDSKNLGKGRKSDNEREAGGGTIEMDLTVEAQAEGTLVLTGARPGIDGTYRIVSVTHKASRSSGATTTLEVKQPTAGAGKDGRKAG